MCGVCFFPDGIQSPAEKTHEEDEKEMGMKEEEERRWQEERRMKEERRQQEREEAQERERRELERLQQELVSEISTTPCITPHISPPECFSAFSYSRRFFLTERRKRRRRKGQVEGLRTKMRRLK